MQRRQVAAVEPVVRRGEFHRQKGRALVRPIHREDVKGRREHHLRAAGGDHRLEDVDHLRDVGHRDPRVVTVENV